MKRASLASAVVAGTLLVISAAAFAGPPTTGPADAPVTATLASMHEKELHWGMTHDEVADVYDRNGGLIDREYAPLIAKLQPGVEMQRIEADRENRKTSFLKSYSVFADSPSGFDVTPLHTEYTYNNDEAIMRLFKDGKNRSFFFIKDKLYKIYDEVPLKADGTLGETYQLAVTKLNSILNVPGRTRATNPALGLERTTTDWQDKNSHLRADDRSNEHLVGVILEDKRTLANLSTLRAHKAVDPFAIDPAIAAVTRNGVSDPNGKPAPGDAGGAGAKKKTP